jgi:uncharacterized membrane protein
VLWILLVLSHSPLAPLPGVVTLLLLPGATIMAHLRTRPANPATRFVLAVSLSIMMIMVVGGLASLFLPHVGLTHPLNAIPEWIFWVLIGLVGVGSCAFRRCDPALWLFHGVRTYHIYFGLASGLLVVLSLLGVAQLNYSGNNHLAVFATTLDIVVLLVAIVGSWGRSSRWPLNTLLYFVSLALLLSTSLRGAHLYGWDIQKEFGVASRTLSAGVWTIPASHDPFASMLSLTTLPVVLHSLTNLRLLAFFQLVVPAILALLPLAVFSTIRSVPRWINSGRRFVPRPGLAFAIVTGLIVSSVAFSSLLVSITRQAMAVTIFAAIVMVVFDRSISIRPARIIVGLLVIAVSFTHYTTSYLLAGTLLIAWGVGWVWSQGWLGTKKARLQEHRHNVHSRRVLSSALVVVAVVSALGWNLAITRNNALSNTANAFTIEGAKLKVNSVQGVSIPAPEFEKVLIKEYASIDPWIIPYTNSTSVHLSTQVSPQYKGIFHGLTTWWNRLNQLVDDGLWVLLGLSLLYGVFRLGRRQSDLFSADLVGLATAGLLIGGAARFSGTLAALYSPERAAIVTAILLAPPVTMYLDDLATIAMAHGIRVVRTSIAAGVAILIVFALWATGLGSLLFGGYPPGSLTGEGLNAQQFTISTTEFATAAWLRYHTNYRDVVQTDLFGQLVTLSVPGKYQLVPEIVPQDVDVGSYVYLSTPNLRNLETQADTVDEAFYTQYRSTIAFFNQNMSVVFSTGSTRVYH